MGSHRGQAKLVEVRRSSWRSDKPHRGRRKLTDVLYISQRSDGLHRGETDLTEAGGSHRDHTEPKAVRRRSQRSEGSHGISQRSDGAHGGQTELTEDIR